jgi:hypothetical protein
MRDYGKPLTIVLTGTGDSTKANTEVLLDNFIFGNSDNVDARMIVPFAAKPKTGLEIAIKAMKESFGIDGKDYTPVVEPQGGSNLIASAQASHQVPQGCSLSIALDLLAQAKDSGHDTAFICLYDPENAADFDAVDEAKKRGFTTLNLSEGLIDAFQDYESAEDRAKRKALEEEYAAKQELEESDASVPPKKATTPRKRAAKKAVAPVSKAEPIEPEKPVQTLSGASKDISSLAGTEKLIAMAVEREAEKKAARTELSGTIVMPSKLPVDLEPAKDIQDDIIKAAPIVGDSVTVTKSDIVSLGDAMEEMASGFAKAISIYKKIVENN